MAQEVGAELGGNVNPAFLPNCRPPHLLGRLVFTLPRMTSQPSLLNMGRPVSSSCKIRLVAVTFKTTMISMYLPMKLEERVGRHHGHICHGGHCPYPCFVCILCSSGREKEWGTTHTGQKRGWHLPNVTKPVFPLPSCFNKLLTHPSKPCSAVIISKKLFLIPSSCQCFLCPGLIIQ